MKKRLDHWLLSKDSISYQTDFIVLANIAIACWVIYLILSGSVITIEANAGQGKLTIFDAFNTLFSSFASVMIILSWLSSKDLSSKPVQDGGFKRPELSLVWAAWAILVWQTSTVFDFYVADTATKIYGISFSSLNNMLFLWAVSDFTFIDDKRLLRKCGVFKFLQNRKYISFVTITVIVLSFILISITSTDAFLNLKKTFSIEYLFDFFYSSICVIILYLGFKGIVEERYIIKFIRKEPGHLIKSYILQPIILIPFFITFVHGIILMFPETGDGIFEPDTKHLALGILNQLYRCTIVVLFFLLEISWVRINRDKINKEKKKDLEKKDRIISHKNKELELKIETLNRTKVQLHKERNKLKKKEGQIRTLRNEISHRFKNHLRALSVSVDYRIKKYGSDKKSTVFKELVAERGRIEATLSIHEHLDKKGSSEDVNFFDYLDDLCFKLKDAFYFPPDGFIYSLDENSLDKTISYADARGIGISLTELVINTDQHAYDSLAEKFVKITIKMKEEFYLAVSDRGKGVSDFDKIDYKQGRGFGFVSDIIEVQLRGKFKISNRADIESKSGHSNKGVLFEIIIPVNHLELKID